jgi:hypothetical protein
MDGLAGSLDWTSAQQHAATGRLSRADWLLRDHFPAISEKQTNATPMTALHIRPCRSEVWNGVYLLSNESYCIVDL